MSTTLPSTWSCDQLDGHELAPVTDNDGTIVGIGRLERLSALGASRLEPACCRAARLPAEHTGMVTGEQLALLHLATGRVQRTPGGVDITGTALTTGLWGRALWHDDRLLLFCGEPHPRDAADELRECLAQHERWLDRTRHAAFIDGFVRGYVEVSGVSPGRVARLLALADDPVVRTPVGDSLAAVHEEERRIQADRERTALIEAWESDDISMPFGATARLERRVAAYLSVPLVVAHTNGTAAMLAALHGVGVGPGDEVVCPTYTWWATTSPALWLGAGVRFCDVDQLLRLDLESLARTLTPATRAVIVPHLWDQLVDVAAVRDVVGPRVKIVEDASHVFGAAVGSGFVGTHGDAGIFSLQARKPLAAGEGGVLVTRDPDVHHRALTLGHYERVRSDWPAELARFKRTGLGLKLRMSPLNSALAAARLGEVPFKALRLHAAQAAMTDVLADVEQVSVLGRGSGAHPAPYGGTLGARVVLRESLAGRADDVVRVLRDEGVGANLEYLSMLHRERLFEKAARTGGNRTRPGDCPVADSLAASVVALPPVAGRAPHELRAEGERIADVLTGLA